MFVCSYVCLLIAQEGTNQFAPNLACLFLETTTTIFIIIILPLLIFNMIQVVDQYLPDCHVFLGGVFIEVSWHSWVGHVLTSYPPQVASRTHVCLLHLLVKLANEPNVRQVNMSSLYILPCL
jgi:hypothetical protein